MPARLALVVDRDVADRVQHLALLRDGIFPVGLGGKVEPADRRLRKGAEGSQRRGAEVLLRCEHGR
jgi:hypothetical protein